MTSQFIPEVRVKINGQPADIHSLLCQWLLTDALVLDLHEQFTVHYTEDEAARKDSRYHLKSVNAETRGILDELDRTYSAPVCAIVVVTY